MGHLATMLVCASVFPGDAVEPGRIEIHPTWACMGINWHIVGDENRNASVTLRFRRAGTTKWRQALAPWRHEYGGHDAQADGDDPENAPGRFWQPARHERSADRRPSHERDELEQVWRGRGPTVQRRVWQGFRRRDAQGQYWRVQIIEWPRRQFAERSMRQPTGLI